MAGYGSGRYQTRNCGTVEAACRIDIRYLRRMGTLVEGGSTIGALRWSLHGRETGSVGYVVNVRPDDRHLAITFSHKGEDHRHVIRLEAVPMRFGGFRYYAICPRWGRRCEVLPIIGGVIACCQFHRLAYASQSMDRLGRLRERAERCEKQLRKGQGDARSGGGWLKLGPKRTTGSRD